VSGGEPVKVAVVGCGTISKAYLTNLTAFPDVQVIGCADIDTVRAKEVAAEHGISVSGDVDTVLADPDVEMIINLTIPAAHVSVATAALRAGKHVYGEKPFSLEREDGHSLLAEAEQLDRRIGNAPDTFLGAGLQTSQRLIAQGVIGEPQSALVAMQSPGPESWHPSPEFLFQYGGGPLMDIGPYYLTMLVQMFGPVSKVAAAARKAKSERVIGKGPKAGTSFAVEVPTHSTSLVEFAAGPVATMVISFDSPVSRHGFVEITGTEATLRVPDPNTFGGPVRIRKVGDDDWQELPLGGTTAGRGIGALEMAQAIRVGRPHRASGELAMHVVDTMSAISDSARLDEFVPVTVSCQSPDPLPEGWDPYQSVL
jgi:predicted dehydrogenase